MKYIKSFFTCIYVPIGITIISLIITIVMMISAPTLSYGADFDKGEVYWLTQNIYHEARGEDSFGQLMVGIVTLERLNNGRWGHTIKEVVTAPAQFSWYSDGKSDVPDDLEAWKGAKSIAMMSIMLYNTLDRHGVMHYHNNKVLPYWAKSNQYEQVAIIGNHIFYKEVK